MDRETWIVLRLATARAARRVRRARRRFDYSDRLVLLMWLWATLQTRPMCWACARSSYGSMFRPRRLPSVSQFAKRLATPRFTQLRAALHDVLTERGRSDLMSFIDGKAVVVGEHSTDRDARNGIVRHGRYGLGYKLHARAGASGFILEYAVLPLNEGEPNTARTLLRRLRRGGLVLADANYDSSLLYSAVAEKGATLLTRLKGRGKAASTLSKMGAARRTAIALWELLPAMCEKTLEKRDGIERVFAHLTTFGGGMGPLPAWVRRIERVRRWIDAKIAVYHARLLARMARAAAT